MVNNKRQKGETVNRLESCIFQCVAISFRVYSFIFGVVDMLIVEIKKSL